RELIDHGMFGHAGFNPADEGRLVAILLAHSGIRWHEFLTGLIEDAQQEKRAQSAQKTCCRFPGVDNLTIKLLQKQHHGCQRKEADKDADAVVRSNPGGNRVADQRAEASHRGQEKRSQVQHAKSIKLLPAKSLGPSREEPSYEEQESQRADQAK